MIYKTETHLHPKESCQCSHTYSEDIIKIYKERGYSTIIVTPHYSEYYFRKLPSSWPERIDHILKGYKNLKTYEEEYGINILLGLEINLLENGNDYLVYGMSEAFLRSNLNLFDLSLDELVNLCEGNDFLLVQAHPFRDNSDVSPLEYNIPIEVFNGRWIMDARNHFALRYAVENDLIGLSGSDFHEIKDNEGGILTDIEIKSIYDFKNIVRNNNFKIINEKRS